MSREQISKDLALCGLPPMPEMSVEEDAKRMLACRFNLPFERTNLNPLTVQEDAEYLSRLVANPNIPAYVRSLPDYYRRQP
jgi:hypothetical protein